MNRSSISRRDALRRTLYGAAVAGAGMGLGPRKLAARIARASAVDAQDRKMLLVFLRGGNDGVNTAIPYGDAEYDPASDKRGDIYIPPSAAIDVHDSTFCGLHPALQALYDSAYLDGNLAVVHACGLPERTGSHFTDQEQVETGAEPDQDVEGGWVTRLGGHAFPLVDFRGACVSERLQQGFASPETALMLPHIPRLYNSGSGPLVYQLDPAMPAGMNDKLRGLDPAGGGLGTGLRGHFQAPSTGSPFDARVRRAGFLTMVSEDAVKNLTPPYVSDVPSTTTTLPYPDTKSDFELAIPGVVGNGGRVRFMRDLRDSVWMLKETDCRMAGVEFGSFDTHNDQGGITGDHNDQWRTVAHGLRSVYLDMLNTVGEDFITLVITEFGRTSKVNSSSGTDHGKATVMLALGPSVNGGIYNCSASSWPGMLSANNKYVEVATDVNDFIGEAIHDHFGLTTPGVIQDILPSWGGNTGDFVGYLG